MSSSFIEGVFAEVLACTFDLISPSTLVNINTIFSSNTFVPRSVALHMNPSLQHKKKSVKPSSNSFHTRNCDHPSGQFPQRNPSLLSTVSSLPVSFPSSFLSLRTCLLSACAGCLLELTSHVGRHCKCFGLKSKVISLRQHLAAAKSLLWLF